jgi:hypothetical protein
VRLAEILADLPVALLVSTGSTTENSSTTEDRSTNDEETA